MVLSSGVFLFVSANSIILFPMVEVPWAMAMKTTATERIAGSSLEGSITPPPPPVWQGAGPGVIQDERSILVPQVGPLQGSAWGELGRAEGWGGDGPEFGWEVEWGRGWGW